MSCSGSWRSASSQEDSPHWGLSPLGLPNDPLSEPRGTRIVEEEAAGVKRLPQIFSEVHFAAMPLEVLQRDTWYGEPKELGELFRVTKNHREARAALFTHQFGLPKLTPQRLQAWMATLETNSVSAGRRRYARVVLRTALNTAIRWRLITMNAATLIDAPRTTSREIRPLNPDEARALLDTCREHPLNAFVTRGPRLRAPARRSTRLAMGGCGSGRRYVAGS